MELREDYKHTDIGEIPGTWSTPTLDEVLARLSNGATYRSARTGGLPVTRIETISKGFVDFNRIGFANPTIDLTRFRVSRGDILYSHINSVDHIGKVAIYDSDEELYHGMNLLLLRPREGVNSRFIFFLLASDYGRSKAVTLAKQAVSQASISTSDLRSVRIPLPPASEQEAIAAALSDVDDLIAALDRLIEKKRAVKTAAMQQLLTGRQRLPGFSGAWETKRLGDIGSTYGGLTGKSKKHFGTGSAHYIPFMNVMSNVQIDTGYLERVDVAGDEGQNQVQKGDLLFNTSSETPGELGMCAALMDDLRGVYLNSFCFGFRLNSAGNDPLYLAYVFRGDPGRERMYALAQGATRYNLSKRNFLNLSFSLPHADEQRAIAAVLSDMDAEIAALEARRDKTKQIKQGMMQELLIGRTRLVQPVATQKPSRQPKGHNWVFDEAVVLSNLVDRFGSPRYPLGRKRRTKLYYLFHRHVQQDTGQAHQPPEGFLKKAAGPYKPAMRYGGPEAIATEKHYVREARSGKFTGFVSDENIEEARDYFTRWYAPEALEWLERFRYVDNDFLGVLTTVDMALLELREKGAEVSVEGVKHILSENDAWKPKLEQPGFSDQNIERAIQQRIELFGL